LRRRVILAGSAALVMLTGVGMIAGTYYVDSVDLPADLKMYESTTIYYADRRTPMAKIGEENRTVVTLDKVPKHVQHAVVATEDMTFYTNDGVDYKGIVRAAWNNVTGGERQGASTISQQYARKLADLKGISYARKVREAVLATKLNQKYSKDKILELYLNVIYFGRHAYGIEAAAQAYFGKSASDLTVAEGMVLAGLIKDPEGSDPKKGSPYDPTRNPDTAKDRFHSYIKPNMVKLGYLTQQEADTLKYPENVVKVDPAVGSRLRAQWGLDKPEGVIVHHVMDELSDIKAPDGRPRFPAEEVRHGGLQIYTTVLKPMQDAAVRFASGATADSPLFGQPPNLQGALVAVEPGTGRVRAYYGGPQGEGSDYAGWYADPVLSDGKPVEFGAHPPASSFKVYTLAAGLIHGYSVESHWDGTSPKDFPLSNRVTGHAPGPVKNNDGGSADCQTWCTLLEATEKSLNTPYFGLAEAVGWPKVLEVARAAGIRSMWHPERGRQDLAGKNASALGLGTELGIGQFPVTVLDHANGMATFAARGKAAQAHFVQEVHKKGKRVHAESINPKQVPGLTDAIADNITYALSKVPAATASDMNGRQAAGKTGTWQLGDTSDNAHTWMVGYTPPGRDKAKTPGLAAAVWIGNKKDEQKLVDKSGQRLFGATMAAPVWRKFMNAALANTEKVGLPTEPSPVGHLAEGNGIPPSEPAKDNGQGNNGPGKNRGKPSRPSR
jgi:membrane peptidoglycan carboxypeptidase